MPRGRIRASDGGGCTRDGFSATQRQELDKFKQDMLSEMQNLFKQQYHNPCTPSAAISKSPQRVEAPMAGPSTKRRGTDLEEDDLDDNFPSLSSSHAYKKLARATVSTNPIHTSNSFENLSSEVILSDLEMDDPALIIGSAQTSAPAAIPAPVIAPKKTTAPKRPPPVILHDVPSKDVRAASQDIMSATNDMAELRCRGNNISVFTENNEQWKAVKELATRHQLQYHTYTPKEDRRQAWVMRGAHCGTSPEEIQQELLEKFSITASVSAMSRRTRENGILKSFAIPLFQVLLPSDTNPEKLLQVRNIGYFRVTWEKKRGNRQITQCYNCQRFGHSASNCGLTHRCVKCQLDHKPGECANTPELNLKAQCVNCGQEHPANFSECPARVKYLARRAPKPSMKADVVTNIIKNITQPRVIQNPSFTQNGISYAQAATHPSRDPPTRSSVPSSVQRLMQESENEFGLDFPSLELKCTQFFREYDLETNKPLRRFRLLRFIASLNCQNE